ncbi:MAG: CPBP family intramembrane metalloprotease [Acidobacteria bacterium]|nr:CPBP family intramembrane metalloprotease [Acidobacteriota bacterium]
MNLDLTQIGLAGIYHLVFFGLLMPWSAIKSARRLKNNPYPPRRKYFWLIIGQQLFFLLLSLVVAKWEWLDVFARPKNLWSFGLAALLLVALIVVMMPRWRAEVEKRERRVYLFMSGEGTDKILWVVISLLAGIGEELTYRGVMFLLLWRVTGSALAAALIAAVIFGVSHFVQGWKSAVLIGGFALVFHGLYWISGSLLAPMLVHFIYDVTAGMMYNKFGRELGYPTAKAETGMINAEI